MGNLFLFKSVCLIQMCWNLNKATSGTQLAQLISFLPFSNKILSFILLTEFKLFVIFLSKLTPLFILQRLVNKVKRFCQNLICDGLESYLGGVIELYSHPLTLGNWKKTLASRGHLASKGFNLLRMQKKNHFHCLY